MKFQIPRIGWEMDNDGELIRIEDGTWAIKTTSHGGQRPYYAVDSQKGKDLIEHLTEMKQICEHALWVLNSKV